VIKPGRPSKPGLVNPNDLPLRGTGTAEGRLALMHAIAHIEFNAINLAWDVIFRFRDLPKIFFTDWAKVVREETIHFNLIRKYLLEHDCDYGDFDAHDGLWHMAERTKHDSMVRMALVPRVLEARGLDVTPEMIKKFRHAGDKNAVNILEYIYDDEIGHVETGGRWFRYLCNQRDLNDQKHLHL